MAWYMCLYFYLSSSAWVWHEAQLIYETFSFPLLRLIPLKVPIQPFVLEDTGSALSLQFWGWKADLLRCPTSVQPFHSISTFTITSLEVSAQLMPRICAVALPFIPKPMGSVGCRRIQDLDQGAKIQMSPWGHPASTQDLTQISCLFHCWQKSLLYWVIGVTVRPSVPICLKLLEWISVLSCVILSKMDVLTSGNSVPGGNVFPVSRSQRTLITRHHCTEVLAGNKWGLFTPRMSLLSPAWWMWFTGLFLQCWIQVSWARCPQATTPDHFYFTNLPNLWKILIAMSFVHKNQSNVLNRIKASVESTPTLKLAHTRQFPSKQTQFLFPKALLSWACMFFWDFSPDIWKWVLSQKRILWAKLGTFQLKMMSCSGPSGLPDFRVEDHWTQIQDPHLGCVTPCHFSSRRGVESTHQRGLTKQWLCWHVTDTWATAQETRVISSIHIQFTVRLVCASQIKLGMCSRGGSRRQEGGAFFSKQET